jgi:hypothetical protein
MTLLSESGPGKVDWKTYRISLRRFVFVLMLAVVVQSEIALADIRRVANLELMPVHHPTSIVQIPDSRFVFADYRNLYLWRPGDLPRPIEVSLSDNESLNTVWNPTGIHYDDGDLYVANYQGRNILVGRLSADGASFRITRQITHPDLVSPEKVWTSGQYVAVADYDASAVFLFNKSGELIWKRTGIPLAHGVAIVDGFIYVTALGDRKLLKLDLNGDVVAENNASGWNNLLYPTSVAALRGKHGNEIVVLDANRGTLVIYDQGLREIREMGRNAPDMFKRPYGFVVVDDHFLVADTGNYRFVWLSSSGDIESVPLVLEEVRNIGTPERWNHGYAYCSYNQAEMDIGLIGYKAFTGFATLCLYRASALQTQILLPYSRLNGSGLGHRPVNGFGFAWSTSLKAPDGVYQIIGSFNQSIYMVQRGADYVFVDGPRGISVWGVAGAETFLLSVVDLARAEFKVAKDVASRCSPTFAFFNHGSLLRSTIEETLDGAFFSATAKATAGLWLAGTPVSLQPDQLVMAERTSVDDLKILSLLKISDADSE